MLAVTEGELRWEFTSREDELLSLNLVKAHRACVARFAETDLADGLLEINEQLEYRICCIASAVAAQDFRVAFEEYRCLYSMVFMVVPLGNSLVEPAYFHPIRQLDVACLAHSRAHWLAPSEGFDPRELWTEHASGPAGYLSTTAIDAVMRMQLAKLLSVNPNMNCMVEFYFARTYESLERGLHEFINSTIMREEYEEQGDVPFLHF